MFDAVLPRLIMVAMTFMLLAIMAYLLYTITGGVTEPLPINAVYVKSIGQLL